MQIRLNRFTALLLLLLVLPIVLPIKLYRWVTGAGRKPVYINTIDGDPLSYMGERPLVLALWASWATVWFIATKQIIQQLQSEFSGRCEFVYVEAARASVGEKYKVEVIPAVLVFHCGQEVGRFINVLQADEIRKCIVQRISAEPVTAADPPRV